MDDKYDQMGVSFFWNFDSKIKVMEGYREVVGGKTIERSQITVDLKDRSQTAVMLRLDSL